MKKFFTAAIALSVPVWFLDGMKVTVPKPSKFYEVTSMKEIVTNITEQIHELSEDDQAIAIIDVDNTIARTAHIQGRPEYFSALVRHLVQNLHEDEEIAKNQVLLEVFNAQRDSNLITIKNTEHDEGPDARILVDLFHKHDIPVFAVTSRSTILSINTVRYLTELGFKFSAPDHHVFDFHKSPTNHLVDDARFCYGVLFCGKNKKGPLTYALLKNFNLNPTIVFAVDDSGEHLENIATTLHYYTPRMIGYRYGFLDAEVRAFTLTPELMPEWALKPPTTTESFDQMPVGSPTADTASPSSCPIKMSGSDSRL